MRKRFPSDYVGWVYIYCTKSDIKGARENFYFEEFNRLGKVVARFWCDEVEYCEDTTILNDDDYDLECACLTAKEIQTYGKQVYAIHISQLEIFGKPKELSEFGLKRAPQSRQYIEVDE